MKIAVWYNLPSGGAKRALYYHVRGLVERGHHVEAWCPPMADQTYLPLGDLVEQHIVPMDRIWGPPRTLSQRLTGRYGQMTTMLDALSKHCQQCASDIEAKKFDLLFANTCQLSACPPIGRFVSIPRLVYLQEPARGMYEGFRAGPDGLPSQPWVAGPRRHSWLSREALVSERRQTLELQAMRVRAREEVYNARAYDTILVNSIFSRESIFRTYGINARVCYLGIDTELFEDRQRPREDYVIGLGAFQDGKNIEFALRSVAATKPPHPRLVWVGNYVVDGFDKKMAHLAQTLGVEFEARVMVGDEELVELLNRARMMVYAPFLEPFGFAPLEANLCGLPVTAVAEGGLRETIVDGVNGLLAETDPQQMAVAIDRLRDDEALYAHIRCSCRDYVLHKWSLAAAMDRLEENMHRVLRERTVLPAA